MAYKSVLVDVDVEDFDDSDLIDEMQSRGYLVLEKQDFRTVEWHIQNKKWKEALILLERIITELKGISNCVD